MTFHMGCTNPRHVYLGMYSGMCVWYETTSGMASSLAYMMAEKTNRPGEDTWMMSGRLVRRYQRTLMERPKDNSRVGDL